MRTQHNISVRTRAIAARLGPALLLFQRTPLVQYLFPQARVISQAAGLGEVTAWTIATVAGLGAYDSVAGATTLKQLQPVANSSTVPGIKDEALSFVFQMTGADSAPKSWQITGKLPAGLTHTNSTGKTVDSITGVPTESGTFPITITAWEKSGNKGIKFSRKFTFDIATGGASPPAIVANPVSISVKKGKRGKLKVRASGTSPKYQWYNGKSGITKKPVKGATKATFKTPKLKKKAKYWVRVSNAAGSVDSKTATIRVK